MGSGSCSGSSISNSYMTTNYGGTAGRSLKASIGLSPSAATVSSSGTGWKTVNLCNSATACAATSGGVSIITNALANNGNVGIGEYYTGGNAYFSTYGIASGSRNSHILITYSGGTDADAPTPDFVPYTGIDSIEGERTFFIAQRHVRNRHDLERRPSSVLLHQRWYVLEQHLLRIGFQQPVRRR